MIHDADARRARAAFARLSAVLGDVAHTADAVVRRRCPHRGVGSRCHYATNCRNQVTIGARRVCGGDAAVRFDPMGPEEPIA